MIQSSIRLQALRPQTEPEGAYFKQDRTHPSEGGRG
jgi:hypothetical protein